MHANNIEFTTVQLKGEIREHHWISETVALLRTDQEVYVSVDSGKTYFEQNSVLCKEVGCIGSLHVNPIDSNVVILYARNNDFYVTTKMKSIKRGETNFYYKFAMPHAESGHRLTKIVFHATYRNYLLALMNTDANHQRKLNNLYFSKNAGRDWVLLKQNIRDAVWSNGKAENYDDDTILAIRTVPETGYSALFKYDISTGITSNDKVTNAHDIINTDRFTFLATKSESTGSAHLYVSTDNGEEFRPIQLPDPRAGQKSFLLLDTSEGSVFLNVFEKVSSYPYGTVYQSDWTGSRYSHSLLYSRTIPPNSHHQGVADFHKVKSMEGVYIANIMTNLEDDQCKLCQDDCEESCKVGTRITFDKGGVWYPIDAPEKDSLGVKVRCKEKLHSGRCPLNLHGIPSRFISQIHSHQKTAGIIMAVGNVGPALSDFEINTYLSRDAGVTWIEIQKGSYTYEITDNGGLLAIAKVGEQTTDLLYSLNQGTDWITVNFTTKSEAIAVERLHHQRHAPLAKAITIQGRNAAGSVLIHADFSKIDWRDCKGYENPDSSNSDYETFRPRTYDNNNCFLGRIVEYKRRKKESTCYNTVDEENPTIVKNCECDYQDFDCDYYFTRKYVDQKLVCVPEQTDEARIQIELSKLPPRRCYSYYNETRGYRKIAGDSCVGGVDLNPIKRPCPSTVSTLGTLILFTFMAILFTFVGTFLYRNSPALQSMLNPRRPTKSSSVGYNSISQNENDVFGLDDEDEDEPDEIDESSLSQFGSSEFKTHNLDATTRTVSLDGRNENRLE